MSASPPAVLVDFVAVSPFSNFISGEFGNTKSNPGQISYMSSSELDGGTVVADPVVLGSAALPAVPEPVAPAASGALVVVVVVADPAELELAATKKKEK